VDRHRENPDDAELLVRQPLYRASPIPSTIGTTVSAVLSENWKIYGAAMSATPTL